MFKIEKILADGLPVYLSTYLRNNHRIVFCFEEGATMIRIGSIIFK